MTSIIPSPRCPISIRPGTEKDIPFIDALQKMHKHMVGFMPRQQLEGKIKMRTHIFWQKRIREGDCVTPYWYPYETKAGSIRENRLVFPIAPDVHWRDAKPIILPGTQVGGELKPLALPEKAKAQAER